MRNFQDALENVSDYLSLFFSVCRAAALMSQCKYRHLLDSLLILKINIDSGRSSTKTLHNGLSPQSSYLRRRNGLIHGHNSVLCRK